MELHSVVATAPGVAQPAHGAGPHHTLTALYVVREHAAVLLRFLTALTRAPSALCVDEMVQTQEFGRQLLCVGVRYDRIKLSMNDDCRHPGVRSHVDRGIDQADRVIATTPAHDVHRTDCRLCIAEHHTRMKPNG